MAEERKYVTSRKENQILSSYGKGINNVESYAAEKSMELQKVSRQFTNMRVWEKIWDSKVPEFNKSFYYFFTLTQTNPANVLKEVEKYQKFYEELIDALEKVRTGKESKDKDVNKEEDVNHEIESEIIEPYAVILELKEKLSNMTRDARLGKEFTSSSAVYSLHKSFIEKHKKLEHMIKQEECVALKQGLTKAIEGWQESKQSLKMLEADLSNSNEKCDEMSEKLDQVIEDNKILREIMQKYLLEDKQNRDLSLGNSAGKESSN